MSIDGYIAGPKGEMDWMTFDWGEDLKQYVSDLTEGVDCILLGRKLAEGFIPHWAAVADNPDDPEFAAGREFTDTPKIVFSNTLTNSEWNNTTIATGELVDAVNTLKNQDGGDIIAYGGSAFVSSLIKHHLIDELHLFINPVALGEGMGIFKELESKQAFVLEVSKAFACGIVLLRYQKVS